MSHHQARRSCGSLAAIAGVIALLLVPGGLHAETGVTAVDAVLVQPRLRVPLDHTSPAVETIHRASAPSRTVGVGFVLFPGSQGLYDLEGIGGPDALAVPAYEELVNQAGIYRDWDFFTMVAAADLPKLATLLDLLNVEYLLH